jgi:putative transposase
LVRAHRDQYGLNRILRVLGLPKSIWYDVQRRREYEARHEELKKPLMEVAKDHPKYGYRRTTSELHDRGHRVNRKVVQRLHHSWDLSLIRRVKPPRPNPIPELLEQAGSKVNLVARLETIEDFEVLYTDFTEIVYRSGRCRAQLMPIVDHGSKLVVGHALGPRCDTDLALEAWRRAKKTLGRFGRRIQGVIVHHDQDGVYTGYRWVNEILRRSRARISYSENGARGNVYIESFHGRLKGVNPDLLWVQEDL